MTAQGGTYAAGIGGGQAGAGGNAAISGGRVTATGGFSGAGIGGGEYSGGAGGTVTISGGTVFAQGTFGSADIGPGRDSTVPGANTFIGGSIRLGASSVVPAPTDGTDPVACAVVAGFEPGEPVAITAGLAGYGVNDIFADDAGCIYLWLPNGTYTFTANGRSRTVSIQNGVGPTGVTVNGEEVAYAPAGPVEWSFDPATHTLRLSGAGPFTLAGVNVIGGVCVAVPDNVANKVTLANLTLRTAGSGQCAFALGTGANVSLSLAGTNVLASGPNRAGLEVAAGRTLFITNAPSDEAGTLFAYGGNCGAGIGGGKNDTGGTITMAGGAVMATSRSTGSYGGAGIGGGAYATGGDVMVTGGSLTATGGNNAPGIGGGATGGGGSLTISGGTVVATGEGNGAGVGGGEGQAGGAVTVTGGSLTATGGGSGGAGIGGGAYAAGAGGSLTVSGGQVVASGYTGAGIGGGHSGTGGVVVVSGGMIIAQSSGGAGIGGGYRGAGGTCTIKGGTVFSQSEDGADIGPGMDGAVAGANTFIGGSIRLGASSVVPAPTDGTDPVACAVVAGFEPGELVAITGLPSTYGVNDIFADDAGCIYLWLPNGTYTFTANGRSCTVSIQNGIGPTGVTVNGEDVAFAPTVPGGWSFDPATHTLKLLNAGPFTLAGANVVGGVQVVIPEGVANAVTLSNLTLRATGDSQCAFALETNAVVAFVLAGSNTLASGYSRAGLEVTAGRTLTVTNAPGDEAGALTATGGYAGAGIGGGNKGDGGALTINGGVVTAFGGVNFASGIGGGANGGGGTVTINGGTVTAVSTRLGAGIGTGGYAANQGRASGTVTISGGTVTAIGGELGAGIGGGDNDPGGTVTISGGTVTATGGERGAGIGGGYNYSKSDSTLVSGGTVTISGGRVTVQGGDSAAGIGGGWGGSGGAVTISGGMVFAQGEDGGADIGPGADGTVPGSNRFTGGTIRLATSTISPTPSNGTARVACAVVTGFAPYVPVVIAGLPHGYGVNDIFADDVGCIYLWLPDAASGYTFTANGRTCTVKVKDGVGPTGVTVNGGDVAFGTTNHLPTVGWAYAPSTSTLTLSGEGPFTLAGTNVIGGVRVTVVSNGIKPTAVTFSDLMLRATGTKQCAFALETSPAVSLLLAGMNTLASGYLRPGLEVAAGQTLSITHAPGDDAASLTVTGGGCAAGIGGGNGGAGGTVTINGGWVSATGGSYGAGIGGGDGGAGGTVKISGGRVFATGGDDGGAGIGGGWSGSGGVVTINGGWVSATGGRYGAGIGGGSGGEVTISGGTVFAQGSVGGADIGPRSGGAVSGSNLFTGGTIRPANSLVGPVPSNGTARVACAVVTGFEPYAPVVFGSTSNLPDYYGTSDIFADGTGCIYLWLPDGDYTFTANGRICTVKVQNGVGTTGVMIDGRDIAFGPAGPTAGWTFNPATCALRLSGAGPFTLAGANMIGGVRVVVSEGVTTAITLSNLMLRAAGTSQCAFALETNAVVSLFLAGTNTLSSGYNRAGLKVAAGRTLSITRAPGDAAGALTATGGYYGAGFGGGGEDAGGTVTISGGRVSAKGGSHGAGIGGGYKGAGGTVAISGGRVSATGGEYGAGIGGGNSGAGGAVTISGGTVFAQGGVGGADIGPGDYGTASGSNTFTGGSIRLANDTIAPAPSNGAARVWCVTVPDLEPGAAVVVALPGSYGVNDLFADDSGKIYLWLPNGDYAFMAGGIGYTATVAGASATATVGFDAPAFATDGTALVFNGTLLSIKITNAQKDVWYTLYTADTLGGDWEMRRIVKAEADGDLVFENISATVPRRFFKVAASFDPL